MRTRPTLLETGCGPVLVQLVEAGHLAQARELCEALQPPYPGSLLRPGLSEVERYESALALVALREKLVASAEANLSFHEDYEVRMGSPEYLQAETARLEGELERLEQALVEERQHAAQARAALEAL